MSDPTTPPAPATAAAAPAAPVTPPAPAAAPQTGQLPLPSGAFDAMLQRLAAQASAPAPAVAPTPPAVAAPAAVAAPVAAPAPAPAVIAPSADVDALRSALLRTSVLAAAKEAGAIEGEVVYSLLAGDFDITTDGRVIVKSDPRVSADDHIRKYLASKPYLLRPLATPGGSTAPSIVTPPAAPAAPDYKSTAGLTSIVQQIAARRGLRAV